VDTALFRCAGEAPSFQAQRLPGLQFLTVVFVAESSNPAMLPPAALPAANLACAKGFRPGGIDATSYAICRLVRVEAQPPEFFFNLQNLKRAPRFLLGFRNERLKVFAQPPDDLEPAVAMDESVRHLGLSYVTGDVEPRWPTLNQHLLQFFFQTVPPVCLSSEGPMSCFANIVHAFVDTEQSGSDGQAGVEDNRNHDPKQSVMLHNSIQGFAQYY